MEAALSHKDGLSVGRLAGMEIGGDSGLSPWVIFAVDKIHAVQIYIPSPVLEVRVDILRNGRDWERFWEVIRAWALQIMRLYQPSVMRGTYCVIVRRGQTRNNRGPPKRSTVLEVANRVTA